MIEVITQSVGRISISGSRQTVYCLIHNEDPTLKSLIEKGFTSRLPRHSYKIITSMDEYPGGPLLQVGSKDTMDFDKAFHQPRMLVSSYVTRDALIRKHLLGQTCANWIATHPTSLLKTNVKTIENLEMEASASLYDVLDETPLGEILQANEDKPPAERVWWMLRPDMSSGSQDLSLFSTVDELQATFDSWETASDEPQPADQENTQHPSTTDEAPAPCNADPSAAHGDAEGSEALANQSAGDGWSSWFHITVTTEETVEETAPRRHVIAQRYVSRPLTFFGGRKFQVSAYVLAVGALRVYVHKPGVLALFAAAPFRAPWDASSPPHHDGLRSHSTFDGTVRRFWDLPEGQGAARPGWKAAVFAQVCEITGELFRAAAARAVKAHFQPLAQAFEVFAVNFAVDEAGRAMLADVRAEPDFHRRTECGAALDEVVQGLYEEIAEVAVKPFYEADGGSAAAGTARLVKVADVDTSRL